MCLVPALLALSFCAPGSAEGLPDMPEPKPEVIHRVEESPHKFYNREAKYTLLAEGLLLTGDSIVTCRNLASGGQENWLPTHKCGSTVALMVGFHAAAEGTAYLLHRAGLHNLERFPRLYVAAGNAQGMAISLKNSFK